MDMPNDMLLEIFSWLPAKSIYKFKCVNNFFNTKTSSTETYFIQKQTHNSLLKKDGDSCFFLQRWPVTRVKAKIEFHHLCPKNQTSGVSDKFLQLLQQHRARVVSSSNGLIFGWSGEEFFICNPVTQSWLPIPVPDYMKEHSYDYLLRIVFECSPEDPNDFMLFLFETWHDKDYVVVKPYCAKEGMWKGSGRRFKIGGRPLRFDMHVYHKKALHFITGRFPQYPPRDRNPYFRHCITAFNVEDGSSRVLRVPKEFRAGSHHKTFQMGIYKWGKLTSSNESICLVKLTKLVFTIWVLTDYEANTWRKILKTRVKAMGIKERHAIEVTGFTVMNGERLIFATKKKVYGYGLTRENYMKLEEICEHGFGEYWRYTCFTTFSDTLRPCGGHGAAATLPDSKF